MTLVLLGTEACHLCEQAQDVVLSSAQSIRCDVFVDDIAVSEELVERYGLRIPVLRHDESGNELDWPFTRQDLLAFLQQNDPSALVPTE